MAQVPFPGVGRDIQKLTSLADPLKAKLQELLEAVNEMHPRQTHQNLVQDAWQPLQ
jgi:hypothetical protein